MGWPHCGPTPKADTHPAFMPRNRQPFPLLGCHLGGKSEARASGTEDAPVFSVLSWSGHCSLSLGLRGRHTVRGLLNPVASNALGRGAIVVSTAPHLAASWCLSAADPFDPLLLPADPDAQPSSKPDLFGEFLNSDSLATPSASFPSTHSAPPPACSPDFLHLGECGLCVAWGWEVGHVLTLHGLCPDPVWLQVFPPLGRGGGQWPLGFRGGRKARSGAWHMAR